MEKLITMTSYVAKNWVVKINKHLFENFMFKLNQGDKRKSIRLNFFKKGMSEANSNERFMHVAIRVKTLLDNILNNSLTKDKHSPYLLIIKFVDQIT